MIIGPPRTAFENRMYTQARMRPQLPRTASHGQIHQQNQHELCELNRTGGYKGCSNAVPVEQRLHYQVTSSRAPPPHAPQGQHEAVPAPGGLHLLRVNLLELGLPSRIASSPTSNASLSFSVHVKQHKLYVGLILVTFLYFDSEVIQLVIDLKRKAEINRFSS